VRILTRRSARWLREGATDLYAQAHFEFDRLLLAQDAAPTRAATSTRPPKPFWASPGKRCANRLREVGLEHHPFRSKPMPKISIGRDDTFVATVGNQ